MSIPTKKIKKVGKHDTGTGVYKRITITGAYLDRLDLDYGDDVVIIVDSDDDAEYPIKIKKKEE